MAGGNPVCRDWPLGMSAGWLWEPGGRCSAGPQGWQAASGIGIVNIYLYFSIYKPNLFKIIFYFIFHLSPLNSSIA